MQTGNERLEADTIVNKIRSGEISVVEAVAEALPEVFRTHVVAALEPQPLWSQPPQPEKR